MNFQNCFFVFLNLFVFIRAECVFETDPVTVLSCVAVDAVGLVEATKGNLRVFCSMAERFMECVKTKTRGCFAEEFVRGSLSELIELSRKCCVNKGEKVSDECPFTNRPQCFSLSDRVQSVNGSEMSIGELEIGDEVLAIDENERIVPSEIVEILHFSPDKKTIFYRFETETGEQISVTPEHLLYVGEKNFLQAKSLKIEENFLFVEKENSRIEKTSIRSVKIETQRGFSTVLTRHGTLLVNRIGASCFSSVFDQNSANFVMAPLRWFHQIRRRFLRTRTKLKTEKRTDFIHFYPKLLNNFFLKFLPDLSQRFTTIQQEL